ncbi:hypothetical protein D3C75_862640 [compost metagenome]
MIRIEPRSVVVFAAALATSLACAGALRWMDGAGEAQAAIAAPSVVRSADGHYWAEAVVDGRPMRMLVDTGASVGAHDFTRTLNTASGPVKAAPVVLPSLAVAGVRLTAVEALVVDADMPASLLGMSYLGRLSGFEARPEGLTFRG